MHFYIVLKISFYSRSYSITPIYSLIRHGQPWLPSKAFCHRRHLWSARTCAMSSSELPEPCGDSQSSLPKFLNPRAPFERSLSYQPNVPTPQGPSSQSSQSQQAASQNGRKRRANMPRIDLANITPGQGGPRGSISAQPSGSLPANFGSQESLSSASGISDDDSQADSPLEDANDPQKRLRLASVSSSNFSNNDDAFDQLEQWECSQGSASVRSQPNGSTIIGDGAYELVGAGGSVCQAVNTDTKEIFQCQVLKQAEFKTFVLVCERIKLAEKLYHPSEYRHLKELIVSEGTTTIKGDNGLWYVLMPQHNNSLHTYVQTRRIVFTERQAQPIFKQIVELVDFCHQIGIYLRDFKLRKFVFVDKNYSKIRLHSVLDLFVAPKIEDDSMSDRCVCPAYVAPEILNMNQKSYAAKPADIWGLGVLMFILLTGHYPFFDSNPRAFFRRIKARKFSYPLGDSISHPARWLLYSLLRQAPGDRPSATELLHSLWLKTDPENLPDETKTTRIMSNSQPTGSTLNQSQGLVTLTNSASQPSLASSGTPMMRLFLATPISTETAIGTRLLPTPDITDDIDQTVPSMAAMPQTAPVVIQEPSAESPRTETNPFLANILSNASISDSQAHLSSHI